jgi:hypothetical protein
MKIACPNCKRKTEVSERQVGEDVECACGTFFTVSRHRYAAAARQRLAVIFGAIGGGVALGVVFCIIWALQNSPAKGGRPVAAPAKTPASASVPPPPARSPEPPLSAVAPPPSSSPAPEARQLPKPFAWWKLDETSGRMAIDSAGRHHASFVDDPVWLPAGGVDGGALELRRHAQFLVVNAPLALASNTVTLTAWLKRDGKTAYPDAGILFWRTAAPTGISVMENGELHYIWKGQYKGVKTGLVIPRERWCLVALAVAPDRAVLYVGNESGLRSFVNAAPHPPDPFSTKLAIGHDTWGGKRTMIGLVDDVRIYDLALSPEQIRTLHQQSQPSSPRN